MGSLAGLASRMYDRADNLDSEASILAKRAAMAIVGALAFDTPVDTSQALSGWQVGLGKPVTTVRGPHYPGQLGSTYRASAQAVIADARTVIARKKPGQPIYISNALPYIQRLDDGYSPQNRNFVATSIKRGRDQLRYSK